jgi:hypothetical protein
MRASQLLVKSNIIVIRNMILTLVATEAKLSDNERREDISTLLEADDNNTKHRHTPRLNAAFLENIA